jgi:PET Domain
LVKDEETDPADIRVGRLFDNGQPTTPSPVKLDRQSAQFDWIPPTSDSQLAAKYMEQLPTDVQPITGSQAAVDRKRALDRQLPVHDLDPDLCQSLTSNKEKKK